MYRKRRQIKFLCTGLLAGALLVAGPLWAEDGHESKAKQDAVTAAAQLVSPPESVGAGIPPAHPRELEDVLVPGATMALPAEIAALPECSPEEEDEVLRHHREVARDLWGYTDGGFTRNDATLLAARGLMHYDPDTREIDCRVPPHPEYKPRDIPPDELVDYLGEYVNGVQFELMDFPNLVECPLDILDIVDNKKFHYGEKAVQTTIAGYNYMWLEHKLDGNRFCLWRPHGKSRVATILSVNKAQFLLSAQIELDEYYRHEIIKKKLKQSRRNSAKYTGNGEG